ncbi:LOW QUALITY PROTEIN: ubiquitin carboxyl-terminal hydrolase 17-like protein 6 [Dugong dugon]
MALGGSHGGVFSPPRRSGSVAVSPKSSSSCLRAAGHRTPSPADKAWCISQKQRAHSDGVPAPTQKLASTRGRSPGVGGGLRNMGNTCYMNAALQCLTYTLALADYMLSWEHSSTCEQQGYCVLCTMQDHITALCHPGDVVEPPHALAGFPRHQQEDAHEFLMSTMDALQRACLRSHRHFRSFSPDTTLIRQIFGGYWRSQIQCRHCQGVSDFDPYLDITLDIQAAQSVNQALEELVTAKELEGENSYCRICQRKVPASKKLTLHSCPEVLILVLKRFSDLTADKTARHVCYPETLDVSRCMSRQDGGPAVQSLYVVLVYVGWTCHTGHYVSYVKAGNGQWYQMDDIKVSACDVTCVLSQQAYVLFYIHQSELVRESGSVPRVVRARGHGTEDTDAGASPGVPEGEAKVNDAALEEEHLGETATEQMTLDKWKIHQA